MARARLVSALVILLASVWVFGLTGAADAQQAPPRRIGVLLVSWSPESKMAKAFREGLRDAGYIEGRDVVIEWRSANGDYDLVPQLAADLVQNRDDVIVVDATVAALSVKRVTSTIPIVMANVADPVGSGLVANLAHPGGNITGLTNMLPDLSAKRLQLLKEMAPQTTRVAVLWNTKSPYSPKVLEELKAAAPSLSIELKLMGVRVPEEIDAAVLAASRAHVQALYVVEDSLFEAHRTPLLKQASKMHLPVTYGQRHWPYEGGLMSYGPSYSELFRRSAGYVDKILKGAKPSDLPIERPTKFELVVNVKAASALGITIPESILLRADEVIR